MLNYEFTWDAFENKAAFSERNIYVQFKMYDELYYVVLPLLEDPKVQTHASITKVEKSRRFGNRMNVVIELMIPKGLKDVAVSNERQIKRRIG